MIEQAHLVAKTAAKQASSSPPRESNLRVDAAAMAAQRRMSNARRKVPRRRHIDPTTCERDYKENEIEFMKAMDNYKREKGRPFPTCGEVLEVLFALGYRRS